MAQALACWVGPSCDSAGRGLAVQVAAQGGDAAVTPSFRLTGTGVCRWRRSGAGAGRARQHDRSLDLRATILTGHDTDVVKPAAAWDSRVGGADRGMPISTGEAEVPIRSRPLPRSGRTGWRARVRPGRYRSGAFRRTWDRAGWSRRQRSTCCRDGGGRTTAPRCWPIASKPTARARPGGVERQRSGPVAHDACSSTRASGMGPAGRLRPLREPARARVDPRWWGSRSAARRPAPPLVCPGRRCARGPSMRTRATASPADESRGYRFAGHQMEGRSRRRLSNATRGDRRRQWTRHLPLNAPAAFRCGRGGGRGASTRRCLHGGIRSKRRF